MKSSPSARNGVAIRRASIRNIVRHTSTRQRRYVVARPERFARVVIGLAS